jgi:hypothetical protein
VSVYQLRLGIEVECLEAAKDLIASVGGGADGGSGTGGLVDEDAGAEDAGADFGAAFVGTPSK